MGYLVVRNWEKWQSYRKDRGTPGWIKIYRTLLSDMDFLSLSDTHKAHLVCIWLLASDRNGRLTDDAALIKRVCGLETEPDLTMFLERQFLEREKKRRQPRDNQQRRKVTSRRGGDGNRVTAQRRGERGERGERESNPTGVALSFDDRSGIDRAEPPRAAQSAARPARDGGVLTGAAAALVADRAASKREARRCELEAEAGRLGIPSAGMGLEELSVAVLGERLRQSETPPGASG